MADDNKDGAAEQGQSNAAPGGQPDPATQGGENVDGLVAKNKELLGELKKIKGKLAAFEGEAAKRDEAKLKEEGKLKELLDKKEAEATAIRDRVRRAELKAAAVANSLVDMEYVDILIKRIEFDENDQPTNVADVFKELREIKPYLFKQDEPQVPGTANKNVAGWKGGTGKTPTLGDLKSMSTDEILKNQDKILSTAFGGGGK
jgi:hypothetical protein